MRLALQILAPITMGAQRFVIKPQQGGTDITIRLCAACRDDGLESVAEETPFCVGPCHIGLHEPGFHFRQIGK